MKLLLKILARVQKNILYKSVLLEKEENTLKFLDYVLKTKEHTAEEIVKWSVLDIYLDNEEFQRIIEKYKKTEKSEDINMNA